MYSGFDDMLSPGGPNTFSSLPSSYSNNLNSESNKSGSYAYKSTSSYSNLSHKSYSSSTVASGTASYDQGSSSVLDDQSYLSDDAAPAAPVITEQDVNTHIKGSLAFGLPKKVAMRRVIPADVNNHKINVKRITTKVVKSTASNSSDGGISVDTSKGLLVHRPVVPKKKETVNITHLSEELQQGYK